MEKYIKNILLSRLRRHDKWLEKELEKWNHTSHLTYCNNTSGWDVIDDEDCTIIMIYCDNGSGFARSEPIEKGTMFHFGKLHVTITSSHYDNLVCAKYCEFYADIHLLNDFYKHVKPKKNEISLTIIPESEFI